MRVFVLIASIAAFLLAPVGVRAVQTAAKTMTYHTSYRQTHPLPSAGEVTGVMHLSFAGDGTVSGTYRDEFGGQITSVAGGVTGSNLWLSFGTRGAHQFHGVIEKDGTITGTLSNWRGPRQYQFRAVPSTS